jgi:outer membrane protein TolC
VFLQANNGGFFNESSGIGGFQDYAVGVGWQIEGLAFANAGRIRSAESRLRQSALRAEDVRQRLLAEVTAAHRQVRLQRGLIATAAQQVKAAEESFRLAEDRLRGGTGLLLDVLDAQAQLLRARVNQLSAVVEFDKAQYRLFNAVGNRAKPSAR